MVHWSSVFIACLTVRLICARFSIIPDCDEVFNYWEPTHFLTHGFGLQTWEYSPVYAIRSWAYVGLHGLIIKALSYAIPSERPNDSVLFYGLRAVFAIFSAFTEAKLYAALSNNISRRVGFSYLVLSLLSSGMFHASVSYLPSSFALYFVTLALANFVEDTGRSGAKSSSQLITRGFTWLAVAGLLGWPFTLVLALPFGLRFTLKSFLGKSYSKYFVTVVKVLLSSGLILASIVAVDSIAYKKLGVVVPFNIVSYNVLNSDDSTGPTIFGTEPWTYYVFNLAINFNGATVLALLSLLAPLISRRPQNSAFYLLTIISPFFLWLSIFISTPHKEERFLYPVYSSLLLNSALGLEVVITISSKILGLVGIRWTHRGRLIGTVVVIAISIVSLSRSLALSIYYSAPLDVYDHIPYEANATSITNVCVGREWYRYPSSYFLAENQRLKFVKSGFSGLLPGEFQEQQADTTQATKYWWDLVGTSAVPSGMNNQNLEDHSKYVDIKECDYIVDTNSFSVDSEAGEELYITDKENWQPIYCGKFLDSSASSGIGRVLMLPPPLVTSTNTKLAGLYYCLMKRISSEN
ncbi:dolichyl-P-Man:Man(6)GlcNAc(2)-PP-dolichol alpha-1,2-mannosyltransferase [Sugiyamaella lignohabitans]|uniref:Mannosyltransferase n=1 Tax=Sugiyamaella lignohabitans TaxID=796027 RepID=A0A167DJN0_9ASCO|nr:dolichyl-P-Man:Man(6)GlcNAc(2)-PP-dolichol alpha-1,2-mannosyltransferase [Sugiyamaella lignohabitans]ANB12986.1 dolichyl-P-Man:Man(6)GlcNAc(2)-PP-dolichol alpha-1,2-mannosyltransferase [Sugiyamaella lignohabitans]